MQNEFDTEKLANHWVSRSEMDFDTMNNLFNSKDYHWALFIGHLVIEKLLKAVVIKKTNSMAPYTHDLRRLAFSAGLDLTEEQKYWLDTITTFNLNARYDDDKQNFYKKCTLEYTIVWMENIKTLREWIKTKL